MNDFFRNTVNQLRINLAQICSGEKNSFYPRKKSSFNKVRLLGNAK